MAVVSLAREGCVSCPAGPATESGARERVRDRSMTAAVGQSAPANGTRNAGARSGAGRSRSGATRPCPGLYRSAVSTTTRSRWLPTTYCNMLPRLTRWPMTGHRPPTRPARRVRLHPPRRPTGGTPPTPPPPGTPAVPRSPWMTWSPRVSAAGAPPASGRRRAAWTGSASPPEPSYHRTIPLSGGMASAAGSPPQPTVGGCRYGNKP